MTNPLPDDDPWATGPPDIPPLEYAQQMFQTHLDNLHDSREGAQAEVANAQRMLRRAQARLAVVNAQVAAVEVALDLLAAGGRVGP